MPKKTVKLSEAIPKEEPVKAPVTEEKQETLKLNKNFLYIMGGVIVVIVAVALFFYFQQPVQEVKPIVATVNSQPITLNELNSLYASMPPQYQAALDKKAILDKMIESEVLYQEAVKQGIIAEPIEAKAYLLRAKLLSGMSQEEFEQRLAQQNLTEEELLKKYEKQLSIEKFLNQTLFATLQITEEELKDYYNDNKDEFKKGEQVTVRHILVGDNDLTTEQQREKAAQLLTKIAKDNFCDYVKDYSKDTPSIPNCGEYTFEKTEAYVEEFKDLAFKQKAGDIGTVDTLFGTHILWTVKRTPGKTLSFGEVKEDIQKKLLAQKSQKAYVPFYQDLYDRSNVKITFEQRLEN